MGVSNAILAIIPPVEALMILTPSVNDKEYGVVV
jgi:hypothetical protein